MPELITPGLSPDELRDKRDEWHARQWYCREPWECDRCHATFRVEPSDFRTQTGTIPNALVPLNAPAVPLRACALCPSCGHQVQQLHKPEPNPLLADRPRPATWPAVALGLCLCVVIVALVCAWLHLGGWA